MEYPYYVIPDIEALPSAKGEDRRRLVRRIAILVGDPLALRDILDMDSEEFSQFYPDMSQPDPSTADAIDTFLDRYGNPMAAQSKEVMDTEEIVPLPPADYDLSAIETDPIIEPAPTTETAPLVEANPIVEKEEPEKREGGPILSESLARAMIKNGNYSKALEIITDLSLNNPKKSIYFADQIRFLKKLILNQSKQTKQ